MTVEQNRERSIPSYTVPGVRRLGDLSPSRILYSLGPDDQEAYYIGRSDELLFPVDPDRAVADMAPLLNLYGLQPGARPDGLVLSLVLGLNGDRNQSGKLQVIDLASAAGKSELTAVEPTNGTAPVVELGQPVYLPSGFAVASTGDNRTFIYNPSEPGRLFNAGYRRAASTPVSPKFAARYVEGLAGIGSNEWREIYAAALNLAMLSGSVPEELQPQLKTMLLTGIEFQKATMTLEDWKALLLSRGPADFWRELYSQIEARYRSTASNVRRNTPPHMRIDSPERSLTYLTTDELAAQQLRIMRGFTYWKKFGAEETPGNRVATRDIEEAYGSATAEELRAYMAMDAERQDRRHREFCIAAAYLEHGVPPVWIGLSIREVLAGTGKRQLPIDFQQSRNSRAEGIGMFGNAIERDVPSAREVRWGAEIEAPYTAEELVERMRPLARTPLFEVRRRGDSPEAIAAVMWEALTDPKIESKGANIREPKADDEIRAKIAAAVAEKRPVDFLIFGPWGTAPSELRTGGRTTPHLGHLDMLSRLHRIDATMRQVYQSDKNGQAARFHWVNESDAFVPAGLLDASVVPFADTMNRWNSILNAQDEIVRHYWMGKLMFGTAERHAAFDEFTANYARHTITMFDRYDADAAALSPEERQWVEDRRQLIYPIATILDPRAALGREVPSTTLTRAYELLRARVRGYENRFRSQYAWADAADIATVADQLYGFGRRIVTEFYVPTMDSRYHTPQFVSAETAALYERVNPWPDLYAGKIHGRITDGGKNRWWLRVNSSSSAIIHPTHGMAVVRPSADFSRVPTVSMRTYAVAGAEADRYAAVHLKDDPDHTPFHLIQLH